MKKRFVFSGVCRLFSEADGVFEVDPDFADRCVRKAVRLAQKARLALPSFLKLRFCGFCGVYWVPSRTVRVRLRSRRVVYCCLRCGRYVRFPYVREVKARRRVK